MPDTLIAVITVGPRRGRRGKNPNSGNNGPASRRGSPLIKSTYDTRNTRIRARARARRKNLGHDDVARRIKTMDRDWCLRERKAFPLPPLETRVESKNLAFIIRESVRYIGALHDV